MKNTILWLDDFRNPNETRWASHIPISGQVIWVKNYKEFCQWITENGMPDAICFDHDLGDDRFTGYDCAKWLVEYCLENETPLPVFSSHSSNPVGRTNIIQLLECFERNFK